MQRSVSRWVGTFTSPACVHAIESSDDGSHPSRRSVMPPNGDASSKKTNKTVAKVLLHLKPRWRISQAFRSSSRGARNDATDNDKDDGDRDISDTETFVSAKSSELRSFSTDDNSEVPSFHLSPLIFPTGSISRPHPASPVKIIKKLPFGFVIGRQEDAPASQQPSSLTLARNIKQVMPVLHLVRSRSQMVKNKVARAVKGTFRRGSRRGRSRGEEQEEDGVGCNDDEDVFWKKDVRGLRCRRVEDEDTLY